MECTWPPPGLDMYKASRVLLCAETDTLQEGGENPCMEN